MLLTLPNAYDFFINEHGKSQGFATFELLVSSEI